METQILEEQKIRKMDKQNIHSPINNAVFNLLKYTFILVPIVAGLDKFTNLLANWDKYLNPDFAALLPISVHQFMMAVGVIEITAGIIVFLRPVAGGYIVAAWLSLIALTLLASGNYLDVAVRDLVMSVSAFSMGRLARDVH